MSRRLMILALSLCGVAVFATLVWQSAYRQALTPLAERGRADLALAVDRLNGQLQRYRDLAVLMSDHPVLARLARGQGDGAAADALLLAAIDRTGALNMIYAGRDGRVLAAARPLSVALRDDIAADPAFERAMTGALGISHGIDPATGGRAYIYAAPSFAADGGVTGVLFAVVNVDLLEQAWRGDRPAVLFVDAQGEVFITNRSEILGWRRAAGEAGLNPPGGRVSRMTARQVAGHEIWQLDWSVWLPRRALHLARDLPQIGMRAEALIDAGPAFRLAGLQAAVVALICVIFGAALLVAAERRRALAQANQLLESRVAARTAELSGANLALRREVAEREEAEQALKRAQAELVQAGKLSALGQMSAGLSHELNQPLMAIRQFAENGALFLDRDRPEQAAQNLTRIAELSGRMGRIIRNLRAFARQESEPVRRVDLVAVIDSALEMTEARLSREGVQLRWNRPTGPVWAMGGEVRLGQVLVNLITNAADAMAGQSHKRLDILLTDATGGEPEVAGPAIRIRDTGPGIAAPERIFDPFYTTKEVGASEGMGLGLSISYGLVQSFGGAIRGANHPDGGAEFTVQLAPAIARGPDGGSEDGPDRGVNRGRTSAGMTGRND
ncbi:sensor histidine kinase [Pseudooceanicola aestuarii]|uniref:sensor histidine kinase n=1 Tax=Pseudooceanicola aestuarii TaxID=2697319 RepID=UPI0013D71353|nr:ATP-binding protein [Pseudooceanicola aestuarii]